MIEFPLDRLAGTGCSPEGVERRLSRPVYYDEVEIPVKKVNGSAKLRLTGSKEDVHAEDFFAGVQQKSVPRHPEGIDNGYVEVMMGCTESEPLPLAELPIQKSHAPEEQV